MAPTVLAECRPKLRSCYFFVKNVPNASESSVDVEEVGICIGIPDEQVRLILPPTLTLVPGRISGQTSTKCTLTFRTQIKEFSPTTVINNTPTAFSPNLPINESVSINCDFCKESLTDAKVFSRVLPLPSSDEPNDFFCHRHSDSTLSLDPTPCDFFYNYFFYKIHVDNFKIPPVDNKFKCPKCYELLGGVHGKCVKLWSSVVFLSTANKEKSIDKLLKSVAHFVRNLPVQMNKFVFMSSHGSTSHYTLMWIMDRSLVIFESPKDSEGFRSSPYNIYLERKKVMKVLYSHHEQLTDKTEEWMKSFTTSIIPIHSRIESSFLKYLKDVGDSLPGESASVDGMDVSFLDTC